MGVGGWKTARQQKGKGENGSVLSSQVRLVLCGSLRQLALCWCKPMEPGDGGHTWSRTQEPLAASEGQV